ncbi:MAG: hypothetical protein COY58_01610 [Gammaproteobacteria bacterium CG_4_10_14_0_8_um_filter_38_16]|nr:MAG: hypothetical protein COY58_01610 [Gammaproteobacteria bacterium CG_4_10_14_0_8_um_filter_38_16]PJA03551.1 MAG: hypothetical protein COX72_04855 [Gammaproteobacteria bacterium CG_4_10_14_0_2_um_filter_38_22]PJB10449.1 MAG: hypothetical protein CO120_04785 [Gammaproteobacteria bacterium CG_4_9_14_3_um_filter_38_9]
MKHFIRWSLVSCALVGVIGCTTKNYTVAVSSWQGAPARALLRQWGQPTEVKTLSKRRHLYVYRAVEPESVSKSYLASPSFGRTSPQSNLSGLSRVPRVMRQHEAFWCETVFEANASGMIINTEFQGNNCVLSKDDIKQRAFVTR